MGYVPSSSTTSTSNIVSRDGSGNFLSNNILDGYTATATAAGITTLTVSSTQQQFFTGSTTETVTLPVVSTLSLGLQFRIINGSSGVVTVQSSGANTLQAMGTESALIATVISITGTGTDSWSWTFVPHNTFTIPLDVEDGGTGAITLSGVLTGNGTSAVTANAVTEYGVLIGGPSNAVDSTVVGASGDVLTSNGAGVAPTYQTPTAGTVTSVAGTSDRIISTGGATPVIDIAATYVGQTSLTTLGTITAGTWNGTDIAVADGGTGRSAQTEYSVLCGGTTSTAAQQSVASVGTSGQLLTSNGAASLPTFQDAPAGGITQIDGNTGSATGTTVTISMGGGNNGTPNFAGSGSTLAFNLSSSSGFNTILGKDTKNLGSQNTGLGFAVFGNSSGNSNVSIGYAAGAIIGAENVIIGHNSTTTCADKNIIIGKSSGSSYTAGAASNICLGWYATGSGAETNTLRIGKDTGNGNGELDTAIIHGINGVTTSNTKMVTIDSTTSQLGVATVPAGGIVTLSGDSGSATGTTVTLDATPGTGGNGSTVDFAGSGSKVTLNLVNQTTAGTHIGKSSGKAGETGTNNNSMGQSAMDSITSGSSNNSIGGNALRTISSTDGNCAFGQSSLRFTSGTGNVAMGNSSGSGYTGASNYNISIGQSAGGSGSESNTLRIGNGTGAGTAELNKSLIHGIRGITTVNADAIAVLIDSAGQLGTVSSSIRFKENVVDIPEDLPIMNLRPVQFTYKENDRIAYGLIAEEVNDTFPYLCATDEEKLPFSVKYHELPALLLKEIQKLNKRIEELEKS